MPSSDNKNSTTKIATKDAPLQWIEPEGCLRLSDMRKQIEAALIPVVAAKIWDIWQDELPPKLESQVRRKVSTAVRCATRTLSPYSTSQPVIQWPDRSWKEPPLAPNEPDLPPHQLQAYRLTAAVIAKFVRNELEDIHARFQTLDERMPALNQGIRNAVYEVLLRHPVAAWELSWYSRCIFERVAAAEMDRPRFFDVAGAPSQLGHESKCAAKEWLGSTPPCSLPQR